MHHVIVKSFITGQCDALIIELSDGYRVEYGMDAVTFPDMKSALNRHNQNVLHQETCAGWHDPEDSDEAVYS